MKKYECIEKCISNERLTKYACHCDNDQYVGFLLHQDVLCLNSSVMEIISIVEISLRNSTFIAISEYFNDEKWLESVINNDERYRFIGNDIKRSINTAIYNGKKSKYATLKHKDKKELENKLYPNGIPRDISRNSLKNQKIKSLSISTGKIIAETTLNMWKKMYSKKYDHYLWRTHLKHLFPNKRIKRSIVSEKLEIIYQSRNRIAHHEDIVFKGRMEKFITSIEFMSEEFSPIKGCEYINNFLKRGLDRIIIDYQNIQEKYGF